MQRNAQVLFGAVLLQCLLLTTAIQRSQVIGVKPNADRDVHLLPGMFHGLSNQRICLANAISIAVKKNWTLVLPDLRFNYADVSKLFTVPFQFFFDVSALKNLQKQGLSFSWNMPKTKIYACKAQLQLSPASSSFDQMTIPSRDTMDAWAKREGIVCLHDLVTIDNDWMGDYMTPSLKTLIRKSLLPSEQFRVTNPNVIQDELKVVASNVKEILQVSDFVALHARIESDWKDYCTMDWFKDSLCFVGDQGLLDYLQDVAKVKPGSPVYVASGGSLEQLMKLCTVYRCFTRDHVWQPEKSTIPHAREQLVKAYMDFLIAQLAETFIGNRLSTFSMELFHIFNDVGKTALFVNQLECPLGKALTYFGCQPVNFMDCCI